MEQKKTTWASRRFFDYVHKNHLIYNTCWEDPWIDRQALNIQKSDRLFMITSAGCNALDYLMDQPKEIYCVDLNPIQNALLELKCAAIRELNFEIFFQLFGYGKLKDFPWIYHDFLRKHLSPSAQIFWDQKQNYFTGTRLRPTFYLRGSTGVFASLIHFYLKKWNY